MPSGWATIEPKRTPLVTRSACASFAVAQASAIAAARIACKSAVISRARSSTRPAPISAMVRRSLENDGSMESNWALSNPSDTNTLAMSSPAPPSIGSLWQPKQEFESGPLVRLNGGLTPFLTLVGMIAWVAFGRPAPSTVVNFALKSSRPRSMRAGRADGPAAAIMSKSRWEPGGKTLSSQLPPNAAPAAARLASTLGIIARSKSRFMVLPSLLPNGRSARSRAIILMIGAGAASGSTRHRHRLRAGDWR